MTEKELKQWLVSEQHNIETIFLKAAEEFLKQHQIQDNFSYDLKISQEEAYNLVNNQDLCYDRYTTPFAYSLWYQARRLNTFLSNFLTQIIEAIESQTPVEIFDLGAGTGCVQIAFGLVATAYYRKTKKLPLIRIINVDLSPFMLDYLKSFLWKEFTTSYPEVKNILIKYDVYSWSNRDDLQVTNPWLCASYLFDSSDNEDYLLNSFSELIKAFNPNKILLLTSSQTKKITLLNSLTINLKRLNYSAIIKSDNEFIFKGNLQRVDSFRKQLINKYDLRASSYSVTWNDNSFTAIGIQNIKSGFIFNTNQLPQSMDLFNPPLRIRRDVSLNPDQIMASAFEERPSIITGPAGCGKSVVMTEKIINICEHYKWSKSLHFLVTTFNKGLIKQLRTWITDLLESKKIKFKNRYYKTINNGDDGTGEIIIGDQFPIIIKFIHFDMLGQYLLNLQFKGFDEKNHLSFIANAIKEAKTEMKINEDTMPDILNPEFIFEEYHRIFYGMSCKSLEQYQTIA